MIIGYHRLDVFFDILVSKFTLQTSFGNSIFEERPLLAMRHIILSNKTLRIFAVKRILFSRSPYTPPSFFKFWN